MKLAMASLFSFASGAICMFLLICWMRNDYHVHGMLLDTDNKVYDCDSRFRTPEQIREKCMNQEGRK